MRFSWVRETANQRPQAASLPLPSQPLPAILQHPVRVLGKLMPEGQASHSAHGWGVGRGRAVIGPRDQEAGSYHPCPCPCPLRVTRSPWEKLAHVWGPRSCGCHVPDEPAVSQLCQQGFCIEDHSKQRRDSQKATQQPCTAMHLSPGKREQKKTGTSLEGA